MTMVATIGVDAMTCQTDGIVAEDEPSFFPPEVVGVAVVVAEEEEWTAGVASVAVVLAVLVVVVSVAVALVEVGKRVIDSQAMNGAAGE